MSKDDLKKDLEKSLKAGNGPLIARFILACLSDAVPAGGGVISGISGAWAEKEQEKN